ncbi:CHAT domain-containing protein [Thiothrix sp.]|uniref:CHAT domain-containing protein n=1 Tax=Thiothrix sp. TaxID=1032 RepID=UPI00257EB7C2|nr:CHAT domain-containing protein [Thiothrix sp.]
MSAKSYLNFDLLLNEAGDNYQVHVIDSPAGQASRTFTLPFSAVELENFILKIGQNRGSVRSLHIERIDVPSIQKLGGALYEALFGGAIAERFRSSLAIARREGCGLRIRLRLSGAPKLIDIPWELLFDADNNNYIGLSVNTPIIRKLDLATLPEMRQAQGVLQVLVMISSPSNYQQLDVEREWERINTATLSLQKEGRLILTRVEPSLAALQRQLRRGEYHVFHYIGHGGFDRTNDDGVLVLEDRNKKGHLVSGQYLGTILYDQTTLQLVLLNSCSGGRTSVTDPFAGVGQSLLQKGIPAVIAMQFEITDEAAITFSHEFYAALVDGYSIDAAVAEARKMIYAEANQLEWATPVLYTSIDSGSLLREPTPEELQHLEEQRRQREEAKRQAELKHKKEEEAKRQAELKRQTEEAKRQAELKRQQEGEAKRQAELKRQEEEKQQSDLKREEEKEQANQVEPETQPDSLTELSPAPKADQPLLLEPQALLEQMPTPIQESSNTRLWVAGFVAFAIMIGTVLYWKQDGNEPTTTPVRASTQTAIVAPKPEVSKRYQLSIKATPENATITVDDKTYEPGKEWEPGTYTVKAVADGYKSTGQVVTIKDQNAAAVLELEKIRYALTVETTPADARISLLGTNFDYKSGMLLPLGDYTLRVEADGYTPVERVVTIKDQNTEVSLELEKIRYALTVETIPADAHISLPDSGLDYTPGMLLLSGDYKLKVEADGYLPKEKAFHIAMENENLKIELEPVVAIKSEMDAIAAVEETLITTDSGFDPVLKVDQAAMNDKERNGYKLFKDSGCVVCHNGPALGGSSFQKMGVVEPYKTDNQAEGLSAETGRDADRFKFKVPTLRNVEMTSPYFHDGAAKTLEEAVNIMGQIQLGKKFSDAETADIVAFLKTLTGK